MKYRGNHFNVFCDRASCPFQLVQLSKDTLSEISVSYATEMFCRNNRWLK